MHDAVKRARLARESAAQAVFAARLRTVRSHQRAALAAWSAAAAADRLALTAEADRHRLVAAHHEAAAQTLWQRVGRPRSPVEAPGPVNVHLGFHDVGTREAVLMLLHDLGAWDAGRLVDRPGEGAYFEMTSTDPALCETAVRDRLRLALHDLGDREGLVSVLATRAAGG